MDIDKWQHNNINCKKTNNGDNPIRYDIPMLRGVNLALIIWNQGWWWFHLYYYPIEDDDTRDLSLCDDDYTKGKKSSTNI